MPEQNLKESKTPVTARTYVPRYAANGVDTTPGYPILAHIPEPYLFPAAERAINRQAIAKQIICSNYATKQLTTHSNGATKIFIQIDIAFRFLYAECSFVGVFIFI